MIEMDTGPREIGSPSIDQLSPRSCVSDPVSYTAVLPIGASTVARLAARLGEPGRDRRW